MIALLRQSEYSRLAEYEDANDAEQLSVDPAMRQVVDGESNGKSRLKAQRSPQRIKPRVCIDKQLDECYATHILATLWFLALAPRPCSILVCIEAIAF